MSWRKKRKQIKEIKHKAKIIIGLMFTVVIGLIVLLGYKIVENHKNYYNIDSRVQNLKKEKNKDSDFKSIAWLKVQGTKIDMPIVYNQEDFDEFPVQLESFGWTMNSFNKNSTYYDIKGHNIFNLSAHPKIKSNTFHRFEELMAFIYYDFAKDNEYIQLTIDDKDYVFKIFFTGFISKYDSSFLPYSDKPQELGIESILKTFEKNNLYNYDVDVTAEDKIISLSTCTRFYGTDENVEFYVAGRLLREGEKIDHYKIVKNKEYEKVEKKLKGDENNEKDNL